ncbi:MAG: energy transducer TonB [Acidobacteria bacterium]|nr:energy transducer TonB [Acidobacteriota bacterium]
MSDDGRFVVTWVPPSPHITSTGGGSPEDPGIVIYEAARGSRERVEYTTLLTADDIAWLKWATIDTDAWQLRTHPNTGRPALYLLLPSATNWSLPIELDVDIESRRPLQPAADYYPTLGDVRVSAASSSYAHQGKGCGSNVVVPAVSSQELLDRVKFAPTPTYPEVAFRARVSGAVVIEVVVGEDGQVLCTRVIKGLPFGLSESGAKALEKWWFAPLEVDGKPAQFAGLVQIEFKHNGPDRRGPR